MIISISEASKKFKVSRSKLYRMKESGKISMTKKSDDTVGIDISELVRVFGEQRTRQNENTYQSNQGHDLATENYYLKKEIESLSRSLQKSEDRLDHLIASTQEQTKQIFLMQSDIKKRFWQNLWKK